MAIIPEDITTVRVDQLPSEPATLTSLLPHQVGTELKQTTVEAFITLVATAIESGSGVGFLPVSVSDGQTLPAIPENPSFILVGAGTYINLDGFPDLVCTENLNALITVDTHWEISVEIPITPLTGSVQSVTGSAVDNADPLNPVVDLTPTPNLQEVTDVGATTTNTIEIDIDEAEAIIFYSGGDIVGQINTTNDGVDFITSDVLIENATFYRNGNITVKKNSGSPKIHQLPINEDGTFDLVAIIVNANKTAENDSKYTVVANATFTDPTPAEGKGYTVFVRNGTATIGGVGYTAGSLVYRVYHSGAWSSTLINSSSTGTTPDYMLLRSDYTLTNTTGLQKIFNVGTSGNGSFNTGTNKTYCFRACLDFTTLSSSSKNVSFGFLGTATITSINYKSLGTLGVLTTPQTNQLTAGSVATAQAVTSSSASTEAKIILEGTITVTTAGTLIPSIAFSTAQAGMLSKSGNTFEITEIGNNTFTATTNID